MNFENIDLKTYDLNTPYPEVTVTLDSLKQTDEKNYLRNILEEQEETGKDLEEIIQDRINNLYNEIEKLEK